jgi:CAAX prenyl protease-like protein
VLIFRNKALFWTEFKESKRFSAGQVCMAGTGDVGGVGDVASGGVAGGESGGRPAGVWPGLPYVAPLGVFLVVTMIEKELYGLLTKPGAYGVKLLATVAALVWFRSAWPRWSSRGLVPAVLLGALGTVVWVLLDSVQRQVLGALNLSDWLPARAGFQFDLQRLTAGDAVFLGVRFLGLAVVVPLAEELCWRGFLAPWLVNEDFQGVPAGQMTATSFCIVLGVFTSMHPEIVAAIVWMSGMNVLWQRTGNVWACVVAHATTNLLLGIYIVQTGHWWLW